MSSKAEAEETHLEVNLPDLTSSAKCVHVCVWLCDSNSNNNKRPITLAEHTSNHGKQTNSNTNEWGN